MAYGIGRAQKLGKQNRKQIYNTSDPFLEPSTPSFSYKQFNLKTDITSKQIVNCKKHIILQPLL